MAKSEEVTMQEEFVGVVATEGRSSRCGADGRVHAGVEGLFESLLAQSFDGPKRG